LRVWDEFPYFSEYETNLLSIFQFFYQTRIFLQILSFVLQTVLWLVSQVCSRVFYELWMNLNKHSAPPKSDWSVKFVLVSFTNYEWTWINIQHPPKKGSLQRVFPQGFLLVFAYWTTVEMNLHCGKFNYSFFTFVINNPNPLNWPPKTVELNYIVWNLIIYSLHLLSTIQPSSHLLDLPLNQAKHLLELKSVGHNHWVVIPTGVAASWSHYHILDSHFSCIKWTTIPGSNS